MKGGSNNIEDGWYSDWLILFFKYLHIQRLDWKVLNYLSILNLEYKIWKYYQIPIFEEIILCM